LLWKRDYWIKNRACSISFDKRNNSDDRENKLEAENGLYENMM